MAWIFGEKKFGQYTYEHWFDDEYIEYDKIIMEQIKDEDIALIKQWMQKEYIKKWYSPINDWIYEIEKRDEEYKFIKHFIVKINSTKIGFCQYYDCYFAKEEWYNIDKPNKTYSIDYLIGNETFLNKGYGKKIVEELVKELKIKNGKEIIVNPEIENIPSQKVLTANGFVYKEIEKYFYLNIQK
jgi:RimJ/RimL family protein N-acetyltransferase